MASIFTYDTDGDRVPRVSSPWLTPTDTPKPCTPQPGAGTSPSPELLADYGVTRLEAEPQEGPTEYKLHLLLRPRRNYSSSSTGTTVSGSQQHKQQPQNQPTLRDSDSGPILAPSNRSRQKRLEQLTTQLLWRLQQSSPYHASSTSELVLPKLPEAAESLQSPVRPGKLLAGLEDSRGALYEIGVSDDGTFVGLTKDEMDESLTNLRAMAASLGCKVEVIRMVAVGNCEWHESFAGNLRHQAKLLVAEALVTPDLSSRKAFPSIESDISRQGKPPSSQLDHVIFQDQTKKNEHTEQLRITLTGPTTSGKSSLLGTLSTATLDNGRGKSRLSLLKHRHEIGSGKTSSVAQELIGYQGSDVVNFASGNVTTWTDIHASAENDRLIFVSDSPGDPRYRRTTIHGLVGWAPHWTVLCIPADDAENASPDAGGTSSAQDILGSAGAGIDLAKAHLELCLKLEKPLVIAITKLDLVSNKSNLRQTLSKILTAVKATGRTPILLPIDQTKIIMPSDLSSILPSDEDTVRTVVERMWGAEGPVSVVPVLMTSAYKGSGIRLLHALLHYLPMPPAPTQHDFTGLALNPEQPACLFHIADIFGLPASLEPLSGIQKDSGVVVAGYLRFGTFAVGDVVVVGPFPTDRSENGTPAGKNGERLSPNSFAASSHLSVSELSRMVSRNVPASVTKGEWYNAHVVSIRNLRLAVHALEAGQVGTVGIVFDIPGEEISDGPIERSPPTASQFRRGMVLAIPSRHMLQTGHTIQAASGFTASFEDGDINSVTPGSLVVVYIASIRASARILKLVPHANNEINLASTNEHDDDVFGIADNFEKESKGKEAREPDQEKPLFGSDGVIDVTLELQNNREWIELGSQVLIMPGGGQGLYIGSERGEKGIASLEGFVGKVIEVVE